nr:uncharacterized protein LOC107384052 [Nothobranchius furzeri]
MLCNRYLYLCSLFLSPCPSHVRQRHMQAKCIGSPSPQDALLSSLPFSQQPHLSKVFTLTEADAAFLLLLCNTCRTNLQTQTFGRKQQSAMWFDSRRLMSEMPQVSLSQLNLQLCGSCCRTEDHLGCAGEGFVQRSDSTIINARSWWSGRSICPSFVKKTQRYLNPSTDLVPDPEKAIYPFPTQDHGLWFGGADSHPGDEEFSCRPLPFKAIHC